MRRVCVLGLESLSFILSLSSKPSGSNFSLPDYQSLAFSVRTDRFPVGRYDPILRAIIIMRIYLPCISSLFVGVLILAMFTGCSNRKSEPSIFGTWAKTSSTINSIDVLEFSRDGTFKTSQTAEDPLTRGVANAVGALHGNYAVDGKTITIRITAADNQWIGWVRIGEIISRGIVSISPNTLILSGGMHSKRQTTYKRVP